ncbi:hypothetical protein [Marinactinospora rubrisoli]|uniref:Major facilitator superfamily (MFS) profile domain-containing protein n=1 Tax=Marinactinospora rubrisoli TaxID=2715399 RepID=A0ABW2KGY6_9ACTN
MTEGNGAPAAGRPHGRRSSAVLAAIGAAVGLAVGLLVVGMGLGWIALLLEAAYSALGHLSGRDTVIGVLVSVVLLAVIAVVTSRALRALGVRHPLGATAGILGASLIGLLTGRLSQSGR